MSDAKSLEQRIAEIKFTLAGSVSVHNMSSADFGRLIHDLIADRQRLLDENERLTTQYQMALDLFKTGQVAALRWASTVIDEHGDSCSRMCLNAENLSCVAVLMKHIEIKVAELEAKK